MSELKGKVLAWHPRPFSEPHTPFSPATAPTFPVSSHPGFSSRIPNECHGHVDKGLIPQELTACDLLEHPSQTPYLKAGEASICLQTKSHAVPSTWPLITLWDSEGEKSNKCRNRGFQGGPEDAWDHTASYDTVCGWTTWTPWRDCELNRDRPDGYVVVIIRQELFTRSIQIIVHASPLKSLGF